jgi:hypothetical protein
MRKEAVLPNNTLADRVTALEVMGFRAEERLVKIDGRLAHLGIGIDSLSQQQRELSLSVKELGLQVAGVAARLEVTQGRNEERFDRLEHTLAEHGQTLKDHSRRFDRHEELLSDQGHLLRQHSERFDRQDAVLATHGELLKEHGTTLKEHSERFDRQVGVLAQHGALLKEHGGILKEHSGILKEHSKRFDRQDVVLARHETLLHDHGGMLREILRRLPDNGVAAEGPDKA